MTALPVNSLDIMISIMQVKACSMPRLPGYKELISDLGPIHARLSCENSIAKRHPVYKCSEVQVFSCLMVFKFVLCLLCTFPKSNYYKKHTDHFL